MLWQRPRKTCKRRSNEGGALNYKALSCPDRAGSLGSVFLRRCLGLAYVGPVGVGKGASTARISRYELFVALVEILLLLCFHLQQIFFRRAAAELRPVCFFERVYFGPNRRFVDHAWNRRSPPSFIGGLEFLYDLGIF